MDQLCCADDACAMGLTCEVHRCAQVLTCQTQCTIGAIRCAAAGGIESCVAQGVCPVWVSTVSVCPTGTLCVEGATSVDCLEPCAGACTVSALVCTSTGLQACVQNSTDVCPVLEERTEATDVPLCVRGAVLNPDFNWESPTPFRSPIVALAGRAVNDFFVLDLQGNIIHNLLGEWTYEIQPTLGKEQRGLGDCGLPSYLFSVGAGGSAFFRRGGAFNEEFVGEKVTLNAVACDAKLNAIAVGKSGKVYLRSQGPTGTWAAVNSGAAGPFSAVSLMPVGGKAWLVGHSGQIVRCEGIGGPTVTCATEDAGTIENLNGVSADIASGRVFVVGEKSTVLSRGTLGTWAPLPAATALPVVGLNAVGTVTPSGEVDPYVAMVGGQGTIFMNNHLGTRVVGPLPSTAHFTALMMLPTGKSFLGDAAGHLWFSEYYSAVGLGVPTIVGGLKPISEDLLDVASAGSGRLFAVGSHGGRYRRVAGSWSADNGGLAISTPLFAVAVVSPQEVYAVGEAGTVYVRRSGLWAIDSTGLTSSPLNDITVDSEFLYAVGDDGTWLERERALGASWHRIVHGLTTKALKKVAARAHAPGTPTEVIAVGDDCTVLSKTGTAIRALAVDGCVNSTLQSAAFAPAGTVLAGGSGGEVFSRRDGASPFTSERVNGGNDLGIIIDLVATTDVVWALVEGGQIFQHDGTRWRPYTSIPPNKAVSVTADSREVLFGVGEKGNVWRIAQGL